ncbi:SIMPL domain-containing protein [Desulfogranum japonicum]|uniref:SIMPL domain-containing protein n=1 Tax=Desulfogranum japonicum TaxID=231447 RepID=UPI000490AC9A|nr:SIMPL domain-containing protein [Desulfogranum japonicum]
MNTSISTKGASILGISIVLGAIALGSFFTNGIVAFKEYDRTVVVKGLAEREVPANIVIWPVSYSVAENDIASLYTKMEGNAQKITQYLLDHGLSKEEITNNVPTVTDKLAQQYSNNGAVDYRFTASQTITVYSEKVEVVRKLMSSVSELGKMGIVLAGGGYDKKPDYVFTGLNDLKPEMIEEATKKARQVAEKFAADSESRLGTIKRASQGQFSIRNRDSSTAHIKQVRVVSTIEYYLVN